jgi:hypothetical protein
MLGGLISYLLMAIYCREQFNEGVSIERIRELRITIRNELMGVEPSSHPGGCSAKNFKELIPVEAIT